MIKEKIAKALLESATLQYELHQMVSEELDRRLAELTKPMVETHVINVTPEDIAAEEAAEVTPKKKRKYNKHKKEA